jgi:hypothetical protein
MANITRFDPLGEMVSLHSATDLLFEDSLVIPKAEEVKPRQIRISAGNGRAVDATAEGAKAS